MAVAVLAFSLWILPARMNTSANSPITKPINTPGVKKISLVRAGILKVP